jgi:hypothetical protein
MNKWKILSQAFENLGNDFALACENMEPTTEMDDRFDALYTVYVALLETMKTTRQVIANKFDEIDQSADSAY